jgi:hypothetical protein
MNDGYIKTSYKEKKWKIKPAGVWLSLNPVCEHTCLRTQLNLVTGEKRQMNMYEQAEDLGLVRFVLPFDKKELCSWAAYKYKTNINIDEYLMLEYNGYEAGSNPKDWYIKFQDIPVSKVNSIEIFLNGQYVELTDDLELPQFNEIAPIYSNRSGVFDEKLIQEQLNKLG